MLIAAAVTAGAEDILAFFAGDEGVFSMFVKTWLAGSIILVLNNLPPGARSVRPHPWLQNTKRAVMILLASPDWPVCGFPRKLCFSRCCCACYDHVDHVTSVCPTQTTFSDQCRKSSNGGPPFKFKLSDPQSKEATSTSLGVQRLSSWCITACGWHS